VIPARLRDSGLVTAVFQAFAALGCWAGP